MKVFELKEYCGKIMNYCHKVEACESMLTALDADLAVDIYQDTQPGGGNCYRDNRDSTARCEEELDQLSVESVFGSLYRKATDDERVLLTGLLDDFSKKFNDCVPEKADRAYQTTKFIECVCELDFAEREITAEVISVLSKGGDYFQKLVDESYNDDQCKFTFTPDANTAAQFLQNTMPTESPYSFTGEHRIHDDYVISAIPNAFNDKTSWWISKHGCTVAMYCFSTSGSEQNQKKEAEYQLQHIDGYIRAFKSRFFSEEA